MRRVLDHGRWIVGTLLLLGGLVVSSVCSGGADPERVARLGRLQAFVAAAQKKAAERDVPRVRVHRMDAAGRGCVGAQQRQQAAGRDVRIGHEVRRHHDAGAGHRKVTGGTRAVDA
jgi:hypothetical protein